MNTIKGGDTVRKKVIIICLLGAALLCVIGTSVLFIREYAPKHIEYGQVNQVSMGGNYAQGNYVLVSKSNGIKEFPIIWGDGLYLYDIEKERFYLVKDCKVPLATFDRGSSATVQGDKIYYTTGMENPGQDVYMRDISHASKEKVVMQYATHYAVTADHIYYPTEYGTGVSGEIIEKNFKSGEPLVIEKGVFNYMMADEGGLYVYDENKNMVIKISLETKEKTYFKDIHATPEWIGSGKGDHVILIDESGKILDLNGKTGDKRVAGKVNGRYCSMTNCKYIDPYLFYYNEADELHRMDLTNGTQKKILDLASLDGIGKHSEGTSIGSEINFCTDYIAIETCYETGLEDFPKENRSLLIFDYHGNLILENEL